MFHERRSREDERERQRQRETDRQREVSRVSILDGLILLGWEIATGFGGG